MSIGTTYKSSGVNYDIIDPFKRLAQTKAAQTASFLKRFGVSEEPSSRGESAYLIEADDRYLAIVEEGLGTKNLIADAVYASTGKSYYDHLAQDTVAMIVNDMITVGALPIEVAMQVAAGSSEWFSDTVRSRDLIEGWARACALSGAAWGPGETPVLSGVVNDNTVLLSGSAIGMIKPKDRRIKGDIQDGNVIVLLSSSGIHANGLTIVRRIVEQLPEGYATKLSDQRTFGETLLDPTTIYVPIMEDCLDQGIGIHYAINITGHGWRKLLRNREPFIYEIETIPAPQRVFDVIQKTARVPDEEMYATFNMGAGFALYIAAEDVAAVEAICRTHGVDAYAAGTIHKQGDEKKLIIKPKGIIFDGNSLAIQGKN